MDISPLPLQPVTEFDQPPRQGQEPEGEPDVENVQHGWPPLAEGWTPQARSTEDHSGAGHQGALKNEARGIKKA